MITTRFYDKSDVYTWDDLVFRSRSGNFLHSRAYMDYHADRFLDRSLIIEVAGRPVAIFPACQQGPDIISHAGLSYAGLLATADLRAEDTLSVFEVLCRDYRAVGAEKIIYKATPYIFYRYPCQEDLYALFRMGAKLIRRDISSVIALQHDFRFTKGRKWSINKAKKANLTTEISIDFIGFHGLLTKVLKKFGTTPTHSIEELLLLKSRFPDVITLYVTKREEEMLAGALIYDFGDTVHTQYMASSEVAREVGALDLLIGGLIERTYADRRYFSFGISTEQAGRLLNEGLVAQKEGFGARAVTHDFYELPL